VTREDDEEKKKVIRQEFELTCSLNHPNIVKSHDIFENEIFGEIHLVMDFVDGEDLSARLARQRMPLQEARVVISEIL